MIVFGQPCLERVLDTGSIGCDLFFFLSGFLITALMRTEYEKHEPTRPDGARLRAGGVASGRANLVRHSGAGRKGVQAMSESSVRARSQADPTTRMAIARRE